MKATSGTTIIIGLAVAAVIAAVVAGLLVLPSPAEERARRLDERRVEDLRDIAQAMDLYWTRHAGLPASIEELSREASVTVSARDPDTGQDYELRLLDEATYELCATFEGARSSAASARARRDRDASDDFWSHAAGRQCFRLEAKAVPSRDRRQD